MCIAPKRRLASAPTAPSLVVQHSYHNHAHDVTPAYVNAKMITQGASDPFPVRLMHVLDQMEAAGLSHIVAWQPHGRCFVIRNSQQFQELLPRYFNQSKIASFQRQLNLYGFQRITQGLDKGGYYHELFLRGKDFLAYQIVRTKVKGTKVRAKANPDQEPDLWAMEWILPTKSAVSKTLPASQTSNESVATHRMPIVSTYSSDNNDATTSLPARAFISADQGEGEAAAIFTDGDDHSTAELLFQWGKSFHALDSLPDDIESTTTIPPSLILSMLLSSLRGEDDDGDTSFMDNLFD